MTAKKKHLRNQLSTLLETEPIALTLDKLMGTASPKSPHAKNTVLNLPQTTSLEAIAKDLGALPLDESMALFIEKYTPSSYNSLDELLEANLKATQMASNYIQPMQKDSDNLFEGLGDFLDF